MNDLYHRHAEEMVKQEMQEVDRAIEQARLRKEAGLSGPSLLARVANVLCSVLNLRPPPKKVESNVPLSISLINPPKKTECKH
jgi:hypothetical protein